MNISQAFRMSSFKQGSYEIIGWELKILLTPKASHEKLGNIIIDVDGQFYLKVYVTAVPEDNKANKALLDFLSKKFRIPKSKLHIVMGQTDRRKVVLFESENCPQIFIKR